MSEIITLIDRCVSLIIPNKYRDDQMVQGTIRLFVLIAIVLAVAMLLCLWIFSLSGFTEGVEVTLVVLVMIVGQLYIIYKAQHIGLGMIYFTACAVGFFLFMFYYTGGIRSPFILSLFSLGPILFLFVRQNLGQRWLQVASLSVIALVVLERYYDLPQRLTPTAYILTWMVTYVYNTIFLASTIWIYKDASNRKRTYLESVNRTLIDANADLESFAYIASHDLKTPLRSILSFMSLLEKKSKDQIDENGLEYINIMSTSAQQMNILIEDILEYSRVQTRNPSLKTLDLNRLLATIEREIQDSNKYPNANINISEMPSIVSDAAMLKQAISNIMDNALKYNTSESPYVSVSADVLDEKTIITIKDNGIGIEEQFHDRIFDMFERLHRKEEYKGTGIGLAISRRSIAILGGTLSITESSPEGSTFEITLPVAELEKHSE